MEDDLLARALLNEILQRLGAEGRVTTEERVGDDAQGPHVNGLSVPLLQHDLGRCVSERASHGGKGLAFAFKPLCNTEVGEYQVRVGVLCQIKQVFGFKIYRVC